MTFEIVDKEDSHGEVAGSLYGSSVRIIMRSPTHVMFYARGIQLWDRNKHGGWHSLKTITRDRASRETYAKPEVVERIDAAFGKGAAAECAKVNGKSKTILVGGGGEKMPLPRVQQSKLNYAAYDAVKPDWVADLTGQVKTCKQCGENLRPHTDHHRFGYSIDPNHPRTLEDCQRLTNRPVVAIRGYGIQYERMYGYVSYFETWDGESYFDVDFCDSKCAAGYGRRAARELELLQPGGEVPVTPFRVREDTSYEKPSTQTIRFQGKDIKV